MKKIILSIIAITFSFGVYAQNLAQADSIWTGIKNETVRGANTDTRVGGAGNAIIAGVRDTLANFSLKKDADSTFLSISIDTIKTGNQVFFEKSINSFNLYGSDGSGFAILSNTGIRYIYGKRYNHFVLKGKLSFQNDNEYGVVYLDTTKTHLYYIDDNNKDAVLIEESAISLKTLAGDKALEVKTDSVFISKTIKSNSAIYSQGIYASIEVDSVTTTQSMTNGVWNKLTAFNVVGLTENCTAVEDSIIVQKTGKYEVQFNFCSQSGTGNLMLETCVFINGIKNGVHTVRDLVAVNTDSNVSCSRFVSLTAGDILDVRVKHDNGTPIDLITKYGSFSVKYIGN